MPYDAPNCGNIISPYVDGRAHARHGQTSDGSLWIGTRGGLSRFDGLHFQTVIQGKRITSLTADNDDRLWIGTTDGLQVLEGKNLHSSLPGEHIRALLTDSDGHVWAATIDSLLVKYSWQNGINELTRTKYWIRHFEGDYPYQQLYEAPDGRIWSAGRLLSDASNPGNPMPT